MEAREKIKKESILKISKINKDYFIITNKYEYYIPKEVIEKFYIMRDDKLLFVDMLDKNQQLFKVKNNTRKKRKLKVMNKCLTN